MSTTNSTLPSIILFGDSLTAWSFKESALPYYGTKAHDAGFGDFLTRFFENKAVVKNEGYPGYTTESIQPQFELLLKQISSLDTPPLLITVWFGANDAAVPSVPLNKYLRNMRRMIEQLVRATADTAAGPGTGTTKILVLNTPPLGLPAHVTYDSDDAKANAEDQQNVRESMGWRVWVQKMRYARELGRLVRDDMEAVQPRVGFLDVWRVLIDRGLGVHGAEPLPGSEADMEMGDEEWAVSLKLPGSGWPGAKAFPQGYFVDGLHFGESANADVTEAITEKLQSKWPEILKLD